MTLLDRIMALTTAIESRVALADWAGATDLDLERRELLRDLFATQPEVARDNGARAILEQPANNILIYTLYYFLLFENNF